MTDRQHSPSAKEPRPTVWRDRPPPEKGAVAALGNFDGVHLGHRRLVARVKAEAALRGAGAAVVTFEPHPRDFFRPERPSFRLTPERAKLKILGRLGIDEVMLRTFDGALARTAAAAFVDDLLGRECGLAGVVVGENFRFGRDREGDPAMLERLAGQRGIDTWIESAEESGGEPVSSSRIRAMLEAGAIERANPLLGYRWFVDGEVRHGDKRGRTLGFPTANVALEPGCRLAHGIYAVRVATAPGEIRDGVASFGRRPTFDDGAPLLETFVFDFSGDLYGRRIEVEFAGWIRGEERFSSADELVTRMNRDADEARAILRRPDRLDSFIG